MPFYQKPRGQFGKIPCFASVASLPSPPPHPPGFCVWVWGESEWIRSEQGLQAQGPQLPLTSMFLYPWQVWLQTGSGFLSRFSSGVSQALHHLAPTYLSRLPASPACALHTCLLRCTFFSHHSCVPTSWLHAHYPSACCLTHFTSPSPRLDRGDTLACSHHIWLCGSSLWALTWSSESCWAADSVCGSGGLYRPTLLTWEWALCGQLLCLLLVPVQGSLGALVSVQLCLCHPSLGLHLGLWWPPASFPFGLSSPPALPPLWVVMTWILSIILCLELS